jgi:hypothetical protein
VIGPPANESLNANAPYSLCDLDVSGNTYAPTPSLIVLPDGTVLDRPARRPALLNAALCCVLCNDSRLAYDPKTGKYERVGEATEVRFPFFFFIMCREID